MTVESPSGLEETRPVKEKELRLALVCYGGVSLVLYMHGVIKEILKLARASKTFHSIAIRNVDKPTHSHR
jgi:hypothetical protein